jgi:tetratricopeptide (TPR) repeat protein
MAYRFVPIKTVSETGETGRIETDILYKKMMEEFSWGGIDNPKVYLDENNTRMLMNVKNNFARLAKALVSEGKKDSAIKVLDKCEQIMPNERVPYNYYNLLLAEGYYMAGDTVKANKMVKTLAQNSFEELDFYLSLSPERVVLLDMDKRRAFAILRELVDRTQAIGQIQLSKELEDRFMQIFQKYPNAFK